MRYEKPRSISDLLKDFVSENKLEEGLFASGIIRNFRKIIGEQSASCLTQISFCNGTIYCKSSSSVIRTQLFLRKSNILKELNAGLDTPAVRKIVIN